MSSQMARQLVPFRFELAVVEAVPLVEMLTLFESESNGVRVFLNGQRALVDGGVGFRGGRRFGESRSGSRRSYRLELVEENLVTATSAFCSLDLHKLAKPLERLRLDPQLEG